MRPNRKARRVGVQKGFGPRHAFNAQEGAEAVPSRLPDPPAEELEFKRNSLGNLRPAMLAKALAGELGSLTKEDVAKLGISLLIGGEGPREPSLPPSGKVKQPGLKVHDPAPRYEGPPGNSPIDQLAKDQPKSDEQFPSLNKPPYNALKETDPMPGQKYTHWLGEPVPESPKDPSFPPEDVQKMQDLQDFLKPSKTTGSEDLFNFAEELGPPKGGQNWLDDYMKQADELGLVKPSPQELQDALDALKLPPGEPNVPRFKKGTKGVRHNPKTKTGRPKKIGVERGYGPRHAANAKEGEDLTAVNTDTVPAMLTPREAVLNRNAAELAGRDDIEALNAEGNQLAQQGIDLAGKDKNMKPKQSKPKSGSPYAQGFEKLQVGGPVRPVPKPGGMPVPAARPGSAGLGDVPPMPPSQTPPGYGTPPQPGGGPTPAVDPFPGRGPGGVYPPTLGGVPGHLGPGAPPAQLGGPPEQIGGLQTPQPGLAWQHKRNMAPQGPGLEWQRKRNAAIAAGQDQPAMPPGLHDGGPFTEPPGSWGNPRPMGQYWKGPLPVVPQQPIPVIPPGGLTNQPAPGLYPPGQGIFHGATGSANIEPIGDPNQQQVYGPPIQLSAPDISKLIQQEGQKQGLNPQQIAGLAKAFSSFGGGGGYANQSLSAGEDFGNPNYIGLGTPSYQGGISEVGYPPGIAPNASFSYDRGGWVGAYDPRYNFPSYQFGTSGVPLR